LFITPLFLFSDIFFPIADRFPPALVAVAQFTPLYQAVQLIRGILLGDLSGSAGHALYLFAVGTVFAAFAIWQMQRRVVR
jgi:ABC-type polysaccharide/polyol phosphate export permease